MRKRKYYKKLKSENNNNFIGEVICYKKNIHGFKLDNKIKSICRNNNINIITKYYFNQSNNGELKFWAIIIYKTNNKNYIVDFIKNSIYINKTSNTSDVIISVFKYILDNLNQDDINNKVYLFSADKIELNKSPKFYNNILDNYKLLNNIFFLDLSNNTNIKDLVLKIK